MGYHILLHVKAHILPQYLSFVTREFFFRMPNSYRDYESLYEGIPAEFRELFERWVHLGIMDENSHTFYEFDVNDDVVSTTLCKKPYRHMGHLESDYRRFLKEIVVPISSVILYCEIEHDDYGDARYEYTDEEIRSPSFG
jgi:hypothetical protein